MIEVMTREITQLFRKAERKLKSLSQFQTTKDGARLITNVQQSIAAELQKLSQEFRKQQKGYLQRLRKQQEVVSLSPTFGGSLLDDGGDYDSGFTESQILKSRESENLVAEREKDIQSIVRSVEELATINLNTIRPFDSKFNQGISIVVLWGRALIPFSLFFLRL